MQAATCKVEVLLTRQVQRRRYRRVPRAYRGRYLD